MTDKTSPGTSSEVHTPEDDTPLDESPEPSEHEDESPPAQEEDASGPTSEEGIASSTKIVITVHPASATIGVRRDSNDPYIQAFNYTDLGLLLDEVPAMMLAAEAQWENEPLHPTRNQPQAQNGAARQRPAPAGNTPQAHQSPNQGTLTLF